MSSKITLADIKKSLNEGTTSYVLEHLDHKEFGLDVWHVTAIEEEKDNSLRKRNYRIFSQGIDDSSPAWWDALQKPTFAKNSSEPSSVPPSFFEVLQDEIKSMINKKTIEFAKILSVDEENRRALIEVVTPKYTEQKMLIKKTENGFETQEIVTV